MSAEFWAIVGMGLTVLVAIGAGQRENNRRFDDVNRRFDDINRRLDTLNERLSRLEGRFEEMRAWSQQIVDALVRRPAA